MMRLRIGEFARLGQVSVQTLRYYDSLDLLKPKEVDCFSGYRYYTLEQLPPLMQILAFKDLGFSLDQITHLLEENLPTDELRRMLELKQQELRGQVQDQIDRLERINARLQWIDQEQAVPDCEVILKRIAPVRVASMRGTVSSYWDVHPLWNQLFDGIQRDHLTPRPPYFTLCHASEPEIELEVCAPIDFDTAAGADNYTRVLPEVETMACTLHQGPFTGLITGFTRLMQWIDTNGYTITGPDREIYLRLPEKDQYHNDQNAVTELQIPVQRRTVQIDSPS
jgi:DNA-binding transcriptional MerR regulator/effector-binding domain-containing protein